MKGAERFLDTNVLLYLLSGDEARADRAEAEIASGGLVSVQVLNEFAAVAVRKLGLSIGEVRIALDAVRAGCDVVPMTEATHDTGLDLAGWHRLPIHDAMILAAATLSGCRVLLSEDFQHGRRFGELVVRNPFRLG